MNKTEQIIEQSFNLVLIPTEAAQMKGSNITPEMVGWICGCLNSYNYRTCLCSYNN